MQDETAGFTQVYGVPIVLRPIQVRQITKPEPGPPRRGSAPWRSRPKTHLPMDASQVTLASPISHLITSLNTDGRGDLYLTDSSLQIEALENSALVAHRYPCTYLTTSLLVAKGNPLQIESVKSLLDKRLTLGIVDPSVDGAGMAALAVIKRVAPDMPEDLRDALIQSFDSTEDLLEALEGGEVDAAFIWKNTNPNDWLIQKYDMEYAERFLHRIEEAKKRNDVAALNAVLEEIASAIQVEKAFAEFVELPAEEEGRTIDIALISLSSSLYDHYNHRFADFLISPQGKKIMRKHGFMPK